MNREGSINRAPPEEENRNIEFRHWRPLGVQDPLTEGILIDNIATGHTIRDATEEELNEIKERLDAVEVRITNLEQTKANLIEPMLYNHDNRIGALEEEKNE